MRRIFFLQEALYVFDELGTILLISINIICIFIFIEKLYRKQPMSSDWIKRIRTHFEQSTQSGQIKFNGQKLTKEYNNGGHSQFLLLLFRSA